MRSRERNDSPGLKYIFTSVSTVESQAGLLQAPPEGAPVLVEDAVVVPVVVPIVVPVVIPVVVSVGELMEEVVLVGPAILSRMLSHLLFGYLVNICRQYVVLLVSYHFVRT